MQWFGVAHDIRSAALRYFNAAGADPDGELGERHDPETHLIPLVIDAALGIRDSIDVYGTDYPTPDGTAVRDYIHVADLADAHVRALKHLLDKGHNLQLNLGTGQGYSVREVIQAVAERAGCDIRSTDCPRRAGDPAELVADARLAQKTLAWQPQHSSLQQIVDDAFTWHESEQPDIPMQAVGGTAN